MAPDLPEDGPLRTDVTDRRVVRVIESSSVLGTAERVLTATARAADSSRVVALVTRGVVAWSELAPSLRRRASGAALLVAVLVHILLTLWHEVPPGWFWLMLPGFAAALGGLLLAASPWERR